MSEGKNATVSVTLKADSGYTSNETNRVSPEQWGQIVLALNDESQGICSDKMTYAAIDTFEAMAKGGETPFHSMRAALQVVMSLLGGEE